MQKFSLLSVFFLVLLFSCKEKSPAPIDNSHFFRGIVVTDEVGQQLGIYGADDNDWKNDPTWSRDIYNILNFSDTVSVAGTYPGDTAVLNVFMVPAYPNPANFSIDLFLKVPGCYKFKMALVDSYYNLLYTYCAKLNSGCYHVMINLEDTVKFKPKTIYRLFYRYSTEANVDFFKGHGDIMVCRSAENCISW